MEARKAEISRLHDVLACKIEEVIDDISTSDEDIDELFSVVQFADAYIMKTGVCARLPSLVEQLEKELAYPVDEYQ
jgi:Zn-finger domain-containing protein